MDSEKRTEYRRDVERRAAALRRMRKDRALRAASPRALTTRFNCGTT